MSTDGSNVILHRPPSVLVKRTDLPTKSQLDLERMDILDDFSIKSDLYPTLSLKINTKNDNMQEKDQNLRTTTTSTKSKKSSTKSKKSSKKSNPISTKTAISLKKYGELLDNSNKRSILANAKQSLIDLSRNDPANLIKDLVINSPQFSNEFRVKETLLSTIDSQLFELLKNLSIYFNQIKQETEKTRLLTVVRHINKSDLISAGFKLSPNSFDNASKWIKNRGIAIPLTPLPSKEPLSEKTIEEIHEFIQLPNISSPAANKSCQIKIDGKKIQLPVHSLCGSKRFIYGEYSKWKFSKNEKPVSISSFKKHIPKNYKRPIHRTDVCSECINFEKLEKKLIANIKQNQLHPECETIDRNCILNTCEIQL